jgi:hypothetical protein
MFSPSLSAVRRAVLIFVVAFLAVASVYRKTPVNFLRAESGWFLAQSHSTKENLDRFERGFFVHSYAGHYTPLAFLAEFKTAELVGTNESFWKWRQILAVAMVAALVCGVVCATTSLFQTSSWTRWAVALAFAAIAVFRPAMIDFVSWPFMIFQLAWIGLFLVALYSILRLVADPEQARWPWIAAVAACLSLQVSGLGMITIVSVGAVLSGLLFVAARRPASLYRRSQKRIALALSAMLLVAAVHGWAMLYLWPSPSSVSAPFHSLARLFFGFGANLAAAAMSSFVPTAIAAPDSRSLAYAWPFGVLIIVGISLFVVFQLRRALSDPTPRNLASLSLHLFTVAAFFALLGLSAVRQFHAASPNAAEFSLSLETTVPRYLVPLHFIALASAIELGLGLIRRAPRFGPAAFCALAVAAVIAQSDFRASTFGYVSPLTRISHAHAWKLLLATVRECRAAGLPVPDVPLDSLTREFTPAETGSLEPLWRRDLRLNPDEKIERISWEQYRAGDRERYHHLVPSLLLLERKLELPPD